MVLMTQQRQTDQKQQTMMLLQQTYFGFNSQGRNGIIIYKSNPEEKDNIKLIVSVVYGMVNIITSRKFT